MKLKYQPIKRIVNIVHSNVDNKVFPNCSYTTWDSVLDSVSDSVYISVQNPVFYSVWDSVEQAISG